MIYLLWPTVRPHVFLKKSKEWLDKASNKNNIEIRVAVNTPDDGKIIKDKGYNYVLVCGDDYKGVAPPSFALSYKLRVSDGDIIVLASDDFCPPPKWDAWLLKQLSNGVESIIVNDGYQQHDCITIPIMTYRCLKAINHIIYYPEYIHLWSDNELYHNLMGLKLVKNLRKSDVMFEHQHWVNGKRESDKHDADLTKSNGHAYNVYCKRMKLKISDRLKVEQKWIDYAKKSYLM